MLSHCYFFACCSRGAVGQAAGRHVGLEAAEDQVLRVEAPLQCIAAAAPEDFPRQRHRHRVLLADVAHVR